MAREVYISVDIEADGPIPGPHSMLSFGAAAFTPEKEMVGTFSANLELLPGSNGHPATMEWWLTQPEAWEAHRKNLETPDVAMPRFVEWVEQVPGKPVFVAFPAGFDFLFMYWYMMRFVGRSPFSFSAIDIKTYGMALLGTDYRETSKGVLRPFKDPGLPHTHIALDDAIEQGAIFCNMLAARKKQVHGKTV